MQPDSLIANEHVAVHAAQYLIGYAVWTLVGMAASYIAWFIFKDDLKEWWAGRKWKNNDEYRRLDDVFIYEWREIGCIEYIAKMEAVFTMYTIDPKGSVRGGRSIIIKNADLAKMHIARFKPHIGDVSQIPDWILTELKKKGAK